MSIISLFCFIALVIIAISCIPKNVDIFSPARIFGFVWFLAIGVTDLKLSRLQANWSELSWIALFIGVFSFYVGLFIAFVLTINTHQIGIVEIRKKYSQSSIDERKIFFLIILFVALYILCYAVEMLVRNGLPIFAASPDKARMNFGMFGFHLFVAGGFPVILILAMEYFFGVKIKSLRKYVVIASFILVCLLHLLLLIRYDFVVFVLLVSGILYYTTTVFKIRNVIIFFSVIIVLFSLMLQIRESKYVENYIYVVSNMRYSKDYAWITGPYMYITMNLENFAHVIDHIQYYTYGLYSFDFIFALTGIKHWASEYFGFTIYDYVTNSFNTFPMFFYFFQDYGMMGLLVLSMMLGFFIELLYRKMRNTSSIIHIGLYGSCIYLMVMSFFTFAFYHLNFIFMSFVLYLIHKNLSLQRKYDNVN